MDKMHNKKPVLKHFAELTKQDFDINPIWVQCHCIDCYEPWYDDTDEETFRPWDKGFPVSPSLAMFLVKSTFTLADGTIYEGFITPQEPGQKNTHPDLGILQPYIFAHNGQAVGFWFGCLNVDKEIKESIYSLIGKNAKDIFPITFHANENLAEGIVSGKVYGFYAVKNGRVHIEV